MLSNLATWLLIIFLEVVTNTGPDCWSWTTVSVCNDNDEITWRLSFVIANEFFGIWDLFVIIGPIRQPKLLCGCRKGTGANASIWVVVYNALVYDYVSITWQACIFFRGTNPATTYTSLKSCWSFPYLMQWFKDRRKIRWSNDGQASGSLITPLRPSFSSLKAKQTCTTYFAQRSTQVLGGYLADIFDIIAAVYILNIYGCWVWVVYVCVWWTFFDFIFQLSLLAKILHKDGHSLIIYTSSCEV